jgi:hypothetical protein
VKKKRGPRVGGIEVEVERNAKAMKKKWEGKE